MSMQMLATNVRTRNTRKRFALGTAMVLVLSLALVTAANAADFTHKYVMRGQVLDVQDNTLVVCIGKEDGA